MNRVLVYIIFLFVIILSEGCNKKEFAGKDNSTERYLLESFRMIILNNDINLHLVQDTVNFLYMSAPEGMQDKLRPNITGDTLNLENNNSGQIFSRYNYSINAELHFTDFNVLFYRGGGYVNNTDTLRMNNLSISTNGAFGEINLVIDCGNIHTGLSTGYMDVILNGYCTTQTVWTTAHGRFDASNMQTKRIYIKNNSSNNCYVNVTDELNAEIQYTGNIYYKGDPEIISKVIHGSGKVEPIK